MNPSTNNYSQRAIAAISLQPGPKGFPDAYGLILPDDTRIILSFDCEKSRQRGLNRIGHIFCYSSGQVTELCVSWQGCIVDLRTIEWLDNSDIESLIAASKDEMHRGIGPSALTDPSSERNITP